MLVLNGDYEEQNDFIVKALQGKCRMNYSGPEHFLTVDPVWKENSIVSYLLQVTPIKSPYIMKILNGVPTGIRA